MAEERSLKELVDDVRMRTDQFAEAKAWRERAEKAEKDAKWELDRALKDVERFARDADIERHSLRQKLSKVEPVQAGGVSDE